MGQSPLDRSVDVMSSHSGECIAATTPPTTLHRQEEGWRSWAPNRDARAIIQRSLV